MVNHAARASTPLSQALLCSHEDAFATASRLASHKATVTSEEPVHFWQDCIRVSVGKEGINVVESNISKHPKTMALHLQMVSMMPLPMLCKFRFPDSL